MTVPTTTFGRTGRTVSRVGLGTYHLTSDRHVAHEEAIDLVRESVRLGVTLIDTAPMYGLGEAEQIVGEALAPLEQADDVYVMDKVGRFEKSILNRLGDECYVSKDLIRAQFEHSMRLLGRDRLDLLMLHESDWTQWWPGGRFGADGPALEALEELKADGRIAGYGLSTRREEETRTLCRTGRFDAMLYVHRCNLVWQESVDDVLPVAAEHDMGVAIGAPYKQGLLLGGGAEQSARLRRERKAGVTPGIIERIERAEAVAADAGLSMPEMGLRWLLSQEGVDSVVVGPRSVAEMEQNLQWAADGPLPPDLLDQIAAIRSIRPGTWEEAA